MKSNRVHKIFSTGHKILSGHSKLTLVSRQVNFLYIPLIILTITATSNAVNLTDGLDGLATGLVAISALVFAAIS